MNKSYLPWLSRGILKSINKKNRLYKKRVRSPNTCCERKYKGYKNKLNHFIHIAKCTYYNSKLEDAKNDLRITRKLLHEVRNRCKNNSSLPSSLKSDGNTITDPMDIADRFCKYFTNIGPNLASAIPTVNSATFHSFLGSKNYPPIILKPNDTRELERICSFFSPKKAPGYDISVCVIKHFFLLIFTPLANIIIISGCKENVLSHPWQTKCYRNFFFSLDG